jgi:hypothetical protein
LVGAFGHGGGQVHAAWESQRSGWFVDFHDFLDKPPILVYIISDFSLLMVFHVSDGSLIESWCLLERFEMLS